MTDNSDDTKRLLKRLDQVRKQHPTLGERLRVYRELRREYDRTRAGGREREREGEASDSSRKYRA